MQPVVQTPYVCVIHQFGVIESDGGYPHEMSPILAQGMLDRIASGMIIELDHYVNGGFGLGNYPTLFSNAGLQDWAATKSEGNSDRTFRDAALTAQVPRMSVREFQDQSALEVKPVNLDTLPLFVPHVMSAMLVSGFPVIPDTGVLGYLPEDFLNKYRKALSVFRTSANYNGCPAIQGRHVDAARMKIEEGAIVLYYPKDTCPAFRLHDLLADGAARMIETGRDFIFAPYQLSLENYKSGFVSRGDLVKLLVVRKQPFAADASLIVNGCETARICHVGKFYGWESKGGPDLADNSMIKGEARINVMSDVSDVKVRWGVDEGLNSREFQVGVHTARADWYPLPDPIKNVLLETPNWEEVFGGKV